MKSLLLAGSILVSATAASAATTGFTLTFDGNNNIPTVSLSNTGDLGSITGFGLSIGNTAYNFDAGYKFVLGDVGSVSLTSGDQDVWGGDRVDVLEFVSTGFDAGETFQFRFDVDVDNKNTSEDYQETVLPGGSFNVSFSGGLQSFFEIDLTPGANDSEPYFYSASVTENYLASASATQNLSAVPLPAGLPLLLVGLGALGVMRNRRS